MNNTQKTRAFIILFGFIGIAVAVGVILYLNRGGATLLTTPNEVSNQAVIKYCTEGDTPSACDPISSTYSNFVQSNVIKTAIVATPTPTPTSLSIPGTATPASGSTLPSSSGNVKVNLQSIVKPYYYPIKAGQEFPINISILNFGQTAATNVRLSDVLPAEVSYVRTNTTQGVVNVSGNTVRLDLGTLGAGQGYSFSITVKAVQAGNAVDTSTVSSDGTEVTPADNQSTQSFKISQ